MTHPITLYLHELQDSLNTGIATEHTHRPALVSLFEALADDLRAANDPAHSACGAPDLVILRGDFIVGHVETKDIGIPLDREERSEQLGRYRAAFDNLILTDYLEFRWYVGGQHRRSVRLGRLDSRNQIQTEANGREELEGLLGDFLAHEPQSIGNARDLAERMARLTHLIRDVIVNAFEKGQASDTLTGWRDAFARVLIPDLDQPEHLGQFADMFAQTLSYGLFSARIMHQTGPFNRSAAQNNIPRTNPFLREFFTFITGPSLSDEPYSGLVDDLIQVLALADLHAILLGFGRGSRQDDPMMHFYETFLAAYDPQLREKRGVYYTPMPVVSFIVRSVDEILKTRFNLPRGLADTTRLPDGTHKVLVLDPAVGTATFLYAVIYLIREEFRSRNDAGSWSAYVRDHLLDRIFGFEIMMAPYAVAHFKLALELAGYDLDLPDDQKARWAYDFQADDRIRVYLTNTLEMSYKEPEGLFGPLQFITKEAESATAIKQNMPIMVILGNPPYSGLSANNNPWISELLRGNLPDNERTRSYYEIDGHPLKEQNTMWLQDDYVKFIRFGEWKVNQTGCGILAYISNNGYLDNPTFRAMRYSLIQDFDELYFLNLHGNARRHEVAPDGSNDENVFDIMQGVAICIFVKHSKNRLPKIINHTDIWGDREHKYQYLQDNDISSVEWHEIKPKKPFFLFIPQDSENLLEFEMGLKITSILPTNGVGLMTARDKVVIDFDPEEILHRVKLFRNSPKSDNDICKDLNIPLKKGWDAKQAREKIRKVTNLRERIKPLYYRPFDIRFIFYHESLVWRPVNRLMSHIENYDNLFLITSRLTKGESFRHAQISKNLVEIICMSPKTSNNAYLFPLYLYPETTTETLFSSTTTSPWPPDPAHGNRVPNLDPAFVNEMAEKLGLAFDPHLAGREHPIKTQFGPEDILAYIYAIFHSPTYRERYAEFLKIDFPRVPLTADLALFRRLVTLGRELLALHLMESPRLNTPMTHFPVPGDNTVAARGSFPKYTPPEGDAGGRVFINREQYFEGVPSEVWAFEIGGYQVLHKWLKDRRGRTLDYDDLEHYQKVVVALSETIRLMAEIDAAIPGWPLN